MKKGFLVLLILVSMLAGALLVPVTSADQTKPLKVWPQNENGTTSTFKVVDDETGVNYIVVKSGELGGIAITPRLNEDGTLFVEK